MTRPFDPKPLLRRFRRHDVGGLSTAMGLSLLPLIGVTGAVVDYSRASALRAELQGAVDAAALAGAGHLAAGQPGGDTAEAVAQRVLEGRVGPLPTPPQIAVTPSSKTLTVTASATSKTSFMQVMRIAEISVSAEAAARVMPPSGAPVCFQAMEPSGTAIIASGSVKINAAPCITWINSSSASSVIMSGTTQVTALRNCVAAGSPAKFRPPAERCAARPDPYAAMTPAAPAGLPTCGPATISGTAPHEFEPCIYTAGITISGSSGAIVFKPGVYVLRDSLTISASSRAITATGVTFVLENGASVTLSGTNVTYNLTAPTSGDFAGFVFYQRPSTSAGSLTVSGSNSFYFEGAVYLPAASVIMSGTNTATTTSPFTAFIAKSYTLSGTSTWAMNYDPPHMTVPVPAGLRTGSSEVALVR